MGKKKSFFLYKIFYSHKKNNCHEDDKFEYLFVFKPGEIIKLHDLIYSTAAKKKTPIHLYNIITSQIPQQPA